MIEIRGLTCRYGAITALDNVSLTAATGEVLGLIGPNGSGKSTLIACAAGIRRDIEGRIGIGSLPLAHYGHKALARIMAVVFQDNVVAFDFTALEIVLMGRSPHLADFEEYGEGDLAIAEGAMRDCDCWQLKDRGINRLSGGERQRVVLARALTQQPRYLLLDEPTSHLDLRHQKETLEVAVALAKGRGAAVISVLHDLNLAGQYCDRLVLLDRGSVVRQGTPEAVLERATLEAVYCTPVEIVPHPRTGRPQVLA